MSPYPSRGLLCDCENIAEKSFAALVLLHIHIQPDTMTHIVLNCAADLQSEAAVLANVDITEAVRRCAGRAAQTQGCW